MAYSYNHLVCCTESQGKCILINIISNNIYHLNHLQTQVMIVTIPLGVATADKYKSS